MTPQDSSQMTAAAVGVVAAAAEIFLPSGDESHAILVGALSAAAVSVAWISVDREESYEETSDSLYAALAVAAVVSAIVSYAFRKYGASRVSKWIRGGGVGLATAAALLLSRHERNSGLNQEQWNRVQYYNENEAAEAPEEPYLQVPSGGWDLSDLTDSKRPNGWITDKFGKTREYVNCLGCEKKK